MHLYVVIGSQSVLMAISVFKLNYWNCMKKKKQIQHLTDWNIKTAKKKILKNTPRDFFALVLFSITTKISIDVHSCIWNCCTSVKSILNSDGVARNVC